MTALVISSPLVANVLPIIHLPMALGNLPIAAYGLPSPRKDFSEIFNPPPPNWKPAACSVEYFRKVLF